MSRVKYLARAWFEANEAGAERSGVRVTRDSMVVVGMPTCLQ